MPGDIPEGDMLYREIVKTGAAQPDRYPISQLESPVFPDQCLL